jgi:dTDP-4-dehydrorhamnose reductase
MRYLITGKNGQLAQAFIKRFKEQSIEFCAPDEVRLDITDINAVIDATQTYKPDTIINCAAYNLVDKAEHEKERVFSVNATGPKNLAHAADRHKAKLVHFGSDYVFDGGKENDLYVEEDPVNPLNEYGKSKLLGEQYVVTETDNSLVLRLSWVFGMGKQNFIHKLLEWTKNNEFLKIACDEFSVPTYTDMVVDVTLKALDQGLAGLYHLTNSGFCSRYEWAKVILRAVGENKFIRPVTMETFNLPAKRPKYSAMSNRKLTDRLNINIPDWEESVKKYLLENRFSYE